MRRIEKFAREQYSASNNGEKLGALVDISKQIVAGLNYSLTFDTSNGDTVTLIVFDQVWTQTTKVISVTRTPKQN